MFSIVYSEASALIPVEVGVVSSLSTGILLLRIAAILPFSLSTTT